MMAQMLKGMTQTASADVLHVMFTRLCLGHLSVCVGDSLRRSEETVKKKKKSQTVPFNAIIIIDY